jgi:hypothetical protein
MVMEVYGKQLVITMERIIFIDTHHFILMENSNVE